MLSISPAGSFSWLFEDPISQEHDLMFSGSKPPETSESFVGHHYNKSLPYIIKQTNGFLSNDKIARKLNHNATERDRRKRISSLYSNLRSLIPANDQSKKLSIPATVARVIKYIPELRNQVQRLNLKKERLMLLKTCTQEHPTTLGFKNQKGINKRTETARAAVSVTAINGREVIVHCSMLKSEKGSFSRALMDLDHQGFLVMNASCFESCDGRDFSNLHLQAQENLVVDAEILKEKFTLFC